MQREQIKQQTITKQNQQNTDVLTKTASAMMREENADAAFEKMLRRPRSKKKLKVYAEVDLPSMKDEEIMERMRKERASGAVSGGSWGGTSWGEGAGDDIGTEEISKEDIAAYLQSRQEEFIKVVQGEIKEEEERERKRKEEEERRRIEEERRRIEEEKARRKIGVLTQCRIEGCYVHFIPAGAGNSGGEVSWDFVSHYSREGVPEDFLAALHLYENCKGCDCVEIWGDRMVAIAGSGEVLKIEKF